MRTLVLMLIFALSACQPRGKDIPEPSPSPEPPVETPADPDFNATIYQGEEPNDYKVELSWNNEVTPVTWYLKRGEKEQELEQIAMLDGAQLDFTDDETEPGKTYYYLLGYTENGDFIIRDRLRVTVPRDVVATKILNKLDFKNVNRVFFRGSSMYCMKSSIEIHANEIIADNATLKYVGYLATDPVNTITITAKKARGWLKVLAFGTDGRTGFRKQPPYITEDMPPSPGSHSPKVHVEILNDKGFSVDVERQPGKGGHWYKEPFAPVEVDGEYRPFCVRLEGRSFGDCHSFPTILKQEVNDE